MLAQALDMATPADVWPIYFKGAISRIEAIAKEYIPEPPMPCRARKTILKEYISLERIFVSHA
jgi:hypothetical protein